MSTAAPDWTSALARARAEAPFLARGLARLPDLADLLARGEGAAALDWARAAGAGADDLAAALRRERLALAVALGVGDLAGAFTLGAVMRALSAFADRALDAAIAEAVVYRVPGAEPAGFYALALGKHGAGELNYSSDIDPILLYDREALPRRARDEPAEAAQRAARRVVETLSAVDSEGYVFRVDLRLRPASEISPLAIEQDAALTHYESSALAWERAAFIRARAAAGDIPAGEAFLAAVRPFVWRRSLDFGAIAEIGRLTAQIRASHTGAARPGPGFDLKRGRGGIREIEFFAQTHQLIHGGRNPALRLRGTRASLDALAAAGIVPEEDAALLGASYDRLRTIEHRLQMIADQQTHSLPPTTEAIDRVARLDGLADGAALVAELTVLTEAVALRYDGLIAAQSGTTSVSVPAPRDNAALAQELAALGFPDAKALAERIAAWRSGKFRALHSPAALEAFARVRPALLAALAAAPDPLRALARWEELLGNLPSAINLFRLLEARPALLALLGRILALAPPLADALARRADLLDPLIDASAFDLPGSVAELEAAFARGEAGDDYERLLGRVRRGVGELRFILGVQLIEGATDPLAVAAALARIAEAALRVLAQAATAEFARVHGAVPGSDLIVLGLGRLGGGALTHASDLDLIYVFSGSHQSVSDGTRPLGATHYFNRLAQRVGGALSVPTADGALYEVDTRLRPSGAQGPLAVSAESFARYQRDDAWTWEHMALTRARPLYGPAAAQAELSETIAAVLAAPRDAAGLRRDVLAMRAEMAAHKPPQGPLDAKLARGGLVDLEFVVHYLQLRERCCFHPRLDEALAALAQRGLIAAEVAPAHDFLTRLLVAARMLAPDMQEPAAPACAALANACRCSDWAQLLAALAQARGVVAAAWSAAFGEALERET